MGALMSQQKKKNTDVDAGKKDDDPTPVVLKVDMHCEGCASKFIRHLRAFPGVETVNAESETGKLTVTGKVDPIKVRDNLAEKMKKKVELISPQPKKEKDTKPDNKAKVKTDNKKSKAKEVRSSLVPSQERETGKLTVTGKVNPVKVRDELAEKMKKKVEFMSPPPKKEKDTKPDNKAKVKTDGKKSKAKEVRSAPAAFGNGNGYRNIGGYNYGPVYPEQLHLHLHLHTPPLCHVRCQRIN